MAHPVNRDHIVRQVLAYKRRKTMEANKTIRPKISSPSLMRGGRAFTTGFHYRLSTEKFWYSDGQVVGYGRLWWLTRGNRMRRFDCT